MMTLMTMMMMVDTKINLIVLILILFGCLILGSRNIMCVVFYD